MPNTARQIDADGEQTTKNGSARGIRRESCGDSEPAPLLQPQQTCVGEGIPEVSVAVRREVAGNFVSSEHDSGEQPLFSDPPQTCILCEHNK